MRAARPEDAELIVALIRGLAEYEKLLWITRQLSGVALARLAETEAVS